MHMSQECMSMYQCMYMRMITYILWLMKHRSLNTCRAACITELPPDTGTFMAVIFVLCEVQDVKCKVFCLPGNRLFAKSSTLTCIFWCNTHNNFGGINTFLFWLGTIYYYKIMFCPWVTVSSASAQAFVWGGMGSNNQFSLHDCFNPKNL